MYSTLLTRGTSGTEERTAPRKQLGSHLRWDTRRKSDGVAVQFTRILRLYCELRCQASLLLPTWPPCVFSLFLWLYVRLALRFPLFLSLSLYLRLRGHRHTFRHLTWSFFFPSSTLFRCRSLGRSLARWNTFLFFHYFSDWPAFFTLFPLLHHLLAPRGRS